MSERPDIPERIKNLAYARDGGICRGCGHPVRRQDAEFDHRPPLWLREKDHDYPRSDARHYRPHANDVEFIETLHGKLTAEDCHGVRTFGNGLALGDVQANAKHQRILRNEDEAEIARARQEGREPAERKSRLKPRLKKKWPKRPIRGWRNMRGDPVWAKPKTERSAVLDPGMAPVLTGFGLLLLLTPSIMAALDRISGAEEEDLICWLMSKNFSQWAFMAGCTMAGIFFMGCGLTMGVWWR